MGDLNPELESFRRLWRAEVSARGKVADATAEVPPLTVHVHKNKHRRPSKPLSGPSTNANDDEDEEAPELSVDGATIGSPPKQAEDIVGFGSVKAGKAPRTALEHYEKAVEKESQGSLGDSLNLYRKAFRMDDNVDKKYKAKHFPPSYFDAKKAAAPGTSHAVGASSQLPSSQSVNDLIAGFRDLRIQPKPAEIEGTPAPACPIAQLPHEILVHILEYVAILDVGDFVRLSQVCKRMAYIVATEEPIWKRVCVGSEVGFGGMHYIWQCGITGEPIEDEDDWIMDPFHKREGEALPPDPGPMCDTLLTPVYSSSWRKMFRQRPRIRFNGVYISTVNYIRPGQASPSQITWNTPVHVVTYYRYLRFFRDGTVISLLTTSEPAEVVHYLTKSHLETHQGEKGSHLPSAVMQTAARGRWRLSSVVDSPEADLKDVEGDLFVETEGVGKYVYRMELSLRSGGKGPKNNKLQWKGYWHYNKLTSDWGEFGLRNDKAFFWSRVRSYGAGE